MSRRRHHDEADEPEGAEGLSGRPVRHSYRADPSAAAPGLPSARGKVNNCACSTRVTPSSSAARAPEARPT